MKTITLVSFLVLLVSPCVLARDADQAADGMKKNMTKMMLTNDSFVKKAAMSNAAEIEISKLALTRSQSPQVKSFAEQMVRDHSTAAKELQEVAQKQGFAVPGGTDHAHQSNMKKMEQLTGADFDKAYGEQMRKDHKKAVSLFSAASEDQSLDPNLRELANKLLPTLRQHQHEAQNLPDDRESSH